MQTNRKYTQGEMSRFFRDQGCELIEPNYSNARQPLKYRCSCGSESIIRWNSFRVGTRCNNCSPTKKPKFEQVVEAYRKHGCELMENFYRNAHEPMMFRCGCGKVYSKPFYAFKPHPFCDDCGQTSKMSQEFVTSFYAKHGCELLDLYKGNSVAMKFKCKCGQISSSNFRVFSGSHQCRDCSGQHLYDIEKVRLIFNKASCLLLENEYKNSKQKLKYICKCGVPSSINLTEFIIGKRCKQCGIRRGEQHGNWNPNRELVLLNKIVASRSHTYLKYLLKKQGKTKKDHAKNYLGYTVAELRERITRHPNWEKIKIGKWHIDHIFPVKAFLEYGITDLKTINALDNLQPLSQGKNLSKGDKYDKVLFEKYLAGKGMQLKNSSGE